MRLGHEKFEKRCTMHIFSNSAEFISTYAKLYRHRRLPAEVFVIILESGKNEILHLFYIGRPKVT